MWSAFGSELFFFAALMFQSTPLFRPSAPGDRSFRPPRGGYPAWKCAGESTIRFNRKVAGGAPAPFFAASRSNEKGRFDEKIASPNLPSHPLPPQLIGRADEGAADVADGLGRQQAVDCQGLGRSRRNPGHPDGRARPAVAVESRPW